MTLNDRFAEWFKGNEAAMHFAACLWEAAQEWDDFQDEGRGNMKLLPWLSHGKEYDPFFRHNAEILRPALLSMQLQWAASNVLDHGDKHDVAKSYMLRAGIYTVWHLMAWIVGGQDWAETIGPDIYREYGEAPAEIWKEFNYA